MKSKNLLRHFKKKAVSDGIVRAAVTSVTVAACAVFITSLVFHILMKDPPILTLLISALALLVICLLFGIALSLRVSERQVAARIDALGLDDRITTMVEFEDDKSILADYQRRDAVIHLRSVSPRDMKSTLKGWQIAACALSVSAAIVLCLLPYEVAFADGAPITDREKQVQEIIDELRDEYTKDLDGSLKDLVNDIIDEAENELLQRPSSDGDSEIINSAINKIDKLLGVSGGDNAPGGDNGNEGKPPVNDNNNPESSDNQNGGMSDDPNINGSGTGSGSASSSNGSGDTELDHSMTEPIFDPEKGTVTYGEIYVFYYADYLEALKNGNIPSDAAEAVGDYFNALAKK